VIAVRAGRLFDSKAGQMLTRQVVLLEGERITDVGPEARIKIPAGAQVIDLNAATVLPGLIDAHTHMFDTPKPGMSRETSTLIAVHNFQSDLRAGFTTARDMSSHGNGYADVEVRNAINERHLDGPRFQVSGRGIVWKGAANATPENPLASIVVGTPDEARAAVREHVQKGVDWIKLFPTGAYSFAPNGNAEYVLTYPMPVLQALIDETHRAGRKAACHVLGGEGQRNAIVAGCDTIEHAYGLNQEQANMMVEKHLFYDPTFVRYPRTVHGRQRQQGHRRQVPDDPDIRKGRNHGRGNQGNESHARQRRRRLYLRPRDTGSRLRSARQTCPHEPGAGDPVRNHHQCRGAGMGGSRGID
jgi:imidazolonepropionase-like amidohydrolase